MESHVCVILGQVWEVAMVINNTYYRSSVFALSACELANIIVHLRATDIDMI